MRGYVQFQPERQTSSVGLAINDAAACCRECLRDSHSPAGKAHGQAKDCQKTQPRCHGNGLNLISESIQRDGRLTQTTVTWLCDFLVGRRSTTAPLVSTISAALWSYGNSITTLDFCVSGATTVGPTDAGAFEYRWPDR